MCRGSVTLVHLFIFLFNLLLYLGILNIVQDNLITGVNKKKSFQIDHGIIRAEDMIL